MKVLGSKFPSLSFDGVYDVLSDVRRYKIITIVLAVRNNGKMQLTPYRTETRIIYLHLHCLWVAE